PFSINALRNSEVFSFSFVGLADRCWLIRVCCTGDVPSSMSARDDTKHVSPYAPLGGPRFPAYTKRTLLLAKRKGPAPDFLISLPVDVPRVADRLRIFRGDFRQEWDFPFFESKLLERRDI